MDNTCAYESGRKRRKTTVASGDSSIMTAVISERDQLASMLKSHGYATDGLNGFLDGPKSEWVLKSSRFNNMVSAFGEKVTYSLFDVNHHVKCALSILSCERFKVVFGQKNQGKSQSLYFIFKLLQHCGALVVYLHPSLFRRGDVNVEAVSEWWNVLGSRLDMPAEFKTFVQFPTRENMLVGLRLLYDVIGKTRPVWVIVDEVTHFTPEHPLFDFLPESEQDLTPVKWICTGSAEMGRWINKMHMGMFLFDLPLFSSDEVTLLINRIGEKVKVSQIVDAIGDVTNDRLVEWLMEKFAGVPGYIVELAIAVINEIPMGLFVGQLKRRIYAMLHTLAPHQMEDLERSLPLGDWEILQDLGLCGTTPPHGFILQYVLDWTILNRRLYSGSCDNARDLICRVMALPGIGNNGRAVGNLLEYRTVLELKSGYSMNIRICRPPKWRPSGKLITIPDGSSVRSCVFTDDGVTTTSCACRDVHHWSMIELDSCFPIIDFAIVNKISASKVICYGVQVTVSPAPFANHRTLDTCSSKNREEIAALLIAIGKFFGVADMAVVFHYVMYAPSANSRVRPPKGHISPFYVVIDCGRYIK